MLSGLVVLLAANALGQRVRSRDPEAGWDNPGTQMSRFAGSVVIDRPAAEVWSFISNPQSASVWGRGVSDVVVTSNGPIGLGSTITLRMSGSPMGARMISYEAPATFTLEFTSGPVRGSKLNEVQRSLEAHVSRPHSP